MGAGAAHGNPLIAMLGMGMMGAPHLQGKNPKGMMGPDGKMVNSPEARNELEVQRARQMTGQGYL